MLAHSDPLSRGISPEALGYAPSVIKNLDDNPTLMRMLELVNPTRVLDLAEDLATIWTELDYLVGILLSPTGGWII
jgi:hypothetical protein